MEEIVKKEILAKCGNVDKNVESQAKRQGLRRISKKLCVVVLACFMFCLPLFAGCSTLCQGGSAASPAPLGPLGDIAPSALGLDPETDKTIYTTESGIEIKISATVKEDGNFVGYPYISMGEIDGYQINWIIIGESTSNGLSQLLTMSEGLSFENKTPAGSAIAQVSFVHQFLSEGESFNITLTAAEEIPNGCLLLLSEYALHSGVWGNTNIYGNSTSGMAYTMDNYYTQNTLKLSSCFLSSVQKTTLVTKYYNSNTTHTSQKYFFPLATYGETETFCAGSYGMNSHDLKRRGYYIKTKAVVNVAERSGVAYSTSCNTNKVVYINTSGGATEGSYSSTYYYRPACVLSLGVIL